LLAVLDAEVNTELGYVGMANVYLVYDEDMYSSKEYWEYFFSEEEAIRLVNNVSWKNLKVEVMPYSTFILIQNNINFTHGKVMM
jgi:hypothetical protein